jgi:hypothetical protein
MGVCDDGHAGLLLTKPRCCLLRTKPLSEHNMGVCDDGHAGLVGRTEVSWQHRDLVSSIEAKPLCYKLNLCAAN